MTDIVQFAVLGIGSGSVYALLAIGLVLIYRGSGTINLSHGHIAVLSAFLAFELKDQQGLPTGVAIPVVLVLAALLGTVIHLLVMRPLRHASPIARVIATLGVLTIINEALVLKYGAIQQSTTPVLPTDTITFRGIVVGQQSLWLAGVATVVVAVLVLMSSRTRIGLAVSAAAENPQSAAALGWSADALAVITWSLGGALAGLAGLLVTSTTSGFFATSTLSLLIVGALAAALFGQFQSYPMALVAGWAIGIAQSESTRYIEITGLSDAIPFLFIVVVLVIRGRSLPVRGMISDRLPSVGTGRVRPLLVIVLTAGVVLIVKTAFDLNQLQAVVTSASVCIVVLSVVVLTGFAGQLSLAQMALGGVGAWAAGRLVADQGWTFGPALIAGVVANVRRGRTGRRLLAVRVNERAAASIGVNVFAAKLYAFALAAAIAGLGGILLAFSYSTILYQQLFGPFTSITVMTIAVIGGVGWVMGPAWGSFLVAGGIGVVLAQEMGGDMEKYVALAGGVLLILLLIISQNGLAAALTRLVPHRVRAFRAVPTAHETGPFAQIDPISLTVTGLTQRFGGVTALKDVDLTVAPGTVVGLMGPNGAGNTTCRV